MKQVMVVTYPQSEFNNKSLEHFKRQARVAGLEVLHFPYAQEAPMPPRFEMFQIAEEEDDDPEDQPRHRKGRP